MLRQGWPGPPQASSPLLCWPLQAEGETTGMFLFAKLVLTNLHSQTTKARLYAELEPENFPEGLEQASVPSPTSLPQACHR